MRYLLLLLFFFSGAALSAESVPYSAVRASLNSWLTAYKTNPSAPIPNARDFVDVSYEVRAKPPVTPTAPNPAPITRYATRPVQLTAARASQALGGALMRSTPAGIGISVALATLPYFFDEDAQTWLEPVGSGYTGTGTCTIQFTGTRPDYTVDQCYEWASSLLWSGENPFDRIDVTGSNADAIVGRVYFTPSGSASWSWTRTTPGLSNLPILPDDVPASDSDIVSGLSDHVPEVVEEIVSSPDYRDQWPELGEVADALKRWAENEFEGASNPIETIDNANNDAVDTPRPSSGGAGGGDVDLPAFCDWVPDWLCNLMDLPENPDVPFVDIDEPDDFNSGIGAGTCPPDIMINLGNYGSVPISWEYPCELASTFKPVVLFFAWITALYIVVRVK